MTSTAVRRSFGTSLASELGFPPLPDQHPLRVALSRRALVVFANQASLVRGERIAAAASQVISDVVVSDSGVSAMVMGTTPYRTYLSYTASASGSLELDGVCSCPARAELRTQSSRRRGCKHMVALAYLYLPPAPYAASDVLSSVAPNPDVETVSPAALLEGASLSELRRLLIAAFEESPAARLRGALELAGTCPRRWAQVAALLRAATDPLSDFEVDVRNYRRDGDRRDLGAPAWVGYACEAISRLLVWAAEADDLSSVAEAALPVLAFVFSPRHGGFGWSADLLLAGEELLSTVLSAVPPSELASLLAPAMADPSERLSTFVVNLLPALSDAQASHLTAVLAELADVPDPPRPPSPADWESWEVACEGLSQLRRCATRWHLQLAGVPVEG